MSGLHCHTKGTFVMIGIPTTWWQIFGVVLRDRRETILTQIAASCLVRVSMFGPITHFNTSILAVTYNLSARNILMAPF